MPNLRGSEWLIIILLLVLLFGARRLPDAARSIGRSLRIFKAETKGLVDDSASPETAPTTSAPTSLPVAPVTQSAPAPIAPAAPPMAPPPVPQAPARPAAEPQSGGSLSPQPPSQA